MDYRKLSFALCSFKLLYFKDILTSETLNNALIQSNKVSIDGQQHSLIKHERSDLEVLK